MATEESPLLNDRGVVGTDSVTEQAAMKGELAGELATGRDVYTAAKTTYDPHNVIGVMCKWNGTIMPAIIMRPALWFSIVVFASVTVCRHEYNNECGQYLPELNVGDIAGTLLPLMTFYLAFFTSECYSRYKDQYTNLKQIEGAMRNIGIMATSSFEATEDLKDHDMIELFRYLTTAYYLLFCRLYDGSDKTFSLETAYDDGLVSLEEKCFLSGHSESMRWFKCLSWAYKHVDRIKERQKLDNAEIKELKGCILEIRKMMNAVTYTYQLPVPLAYYHLITVLTTFVCAIFAYGSAHEKNVSQDLNWLVVLLVLFGFIGMREVAIQLADPFGDDACDLPVNKYVHNVMAFMTLFAQDDSESLVGQVPLNFKDGAAYWASPRVLSKYTEDAKKACQFQGGSLRKSMEEDTYEKAEAYLARILAAGKTADGRTAESFQQYFDTLAPEIQHECLKDVLLSDGDWSERLGKLSEDDEKKARQMLMAALPEGC